jgi:hypothetical protein
MVVIPVVDDEAANEQGFRNVSVFVDGSSGSVDGRHFRRLFASLKLTIQLPCRECWIKGEKGMQAGGVNIEP